MSTNPYVIFKKLIPQSPLQIGTIVSVLNGVATIAVLGGGFDTARTTTLGVSAKVFYRDGVVEGPAPDLTLELIEI